MLFGKQGPTYFGQGLAHCPQRSGLLWAGSGLHLPSLGCFWVGLGYFGEHLPYFAWGGGLVPLLVSVAPGLACSREGLVYVEQGLVYFGGVGGLVYCWLRARRTIRQGLA